MIVYKAENKINSKRYVGQTVKNLSERKCKHLYSVKDNSLSPFHCAIRKYNEENFYWDIIAYCDTKDKLDFLEKFYIKYYNSRTPNGYNLTDGGDDNPMNYDECKKKVSENHADFSGDKHPMYGKHHSIETRKKMSESATGRKHTEETKRKISEVGKGRILSDETRRRMSDSRKGKLRSDETKRKIQEGWLRRKINARPTVCA